MEIHDDQRHITSSASSTSSINQLQEFGIDGLSRLLENADQLAGLADVPWSKEGVRSAFVGAAGRTANAVDVVLRGVGVVIIDDKLDVLHVLTFEAIAAGWGGGSRWYDVMGSVTGTEETKREVRTKRAPVEKSINQPINLLISCKFCASGAVKVHENNTRETPSNHGKHHLPVLVLAFCTLIEKEFTYHANYKNRAQ